MRQFVVKSHIIASGQQPAVAMLCEQFYRMSEDEIFVSVYPGDPGDYEIVVGALLSIDPDAAIEECPEECPDV